MARNRERGASGRRCGVVLTVSIRRWRNPRLRPSTSSSSPLSFLHPPPHTPPPHAPLRAWVVSGIGQRTGASGAIRASFFTRARRQHSPGSRPPPAPPRHAAARTLTRRCQPLPGSPRQRPPPAMYVCYSAAALALRSSSALVSVSVPTHPCVQAPGLNISQAPAVTFVPPDPSAIFSIDVECVATGVRHNDRSIAQIGVVDASAREVSLAKYFQRVLFSGVFLGASTAPSGSWSPSGSGSISAKIAHACGAMSNLHRRGP